MSSDRDVKLPPLPRSQKQSPTHDHTLQKGFAQKDHEIGADFSGNTFSKRKLLWTGSSYVYAGPGRKPQLLMQLESYVKKELQAISIHQPNFQELKLEVYRNVFSCVVSAFRTYQPLLSAIKKEYENTLACQQNVIRELEPLRSHLRLMAKECDWKILAQWGEEQTRTEILKREKQQLLKDIKALRDRGEAVQTMVDHLQSELSNLYLQFRKERDARRLLIWQLNELKGGSVKTEIPAEGNREDNKDSVELKLALKVCQEDLTKMQEELTRVKAEYWDSLEQAHNLTQLQGFQLKALQDSFHQLRSEYDTLQELHKRSIVQTKTNISTAVQTEDSESHLRSHNQLDHKDELINIDDVSKNSKICTLESREAVKTAESHEKTHEHVTVGQNKADGSSDDLLSETPT